MSPLALSRAALTLSVLAALAPRAHADAITDWNQKSGDLIIEAKLGTPPAVRVMAIVQTAAADALAKPAIARDATAAEAAVAAAHRITLAKLLPSQDAAVQAAYQAALAKLPEGAARAAGIAAGEQAATAVLAARADDGAGAPDRYRPRVSAGTWVPTAPAAATTWPQRKPWLLATPAQLRPAPPPALDSVTWLRDLAEVKALGARTSSVRTAEQTEIARFWEFSLPSIYHGVVRSVALAPGRDVARNAQLFATVAQAMDDGLIAVFDAKYHYQTWRPMTAIRHAEGELHDAAWVSLIDAPLHPEYPSAHSILASSVAVILKAEVGSGPMPELSTTSPTAKGATRRWANLDEFAREVGLSRVYAGIHYRFSTEVGAAMGRQVGEIALQKRAGL